MADFVLNSSESRWPRPFWTYDMVKGVFFFALTTLLAHCVSLLHVGVLHLIVSLLHVGALNLLVSLLL